MNVGLPPPDPSDMRSVEDLVGAWRLCVYAFETELTARLEFALENGRLRGSVRGLVVDGIAREGELTFTASHPGRPPDAVFDGRIEGHELAGRVRLNGVQFPWVARRPPTRTHVFEPVTFHLVFSGAIEPALRIDPGDTVRTTTLDNNGRDSQKVRRAASGNPLTGPFYVESAAPGDTLSVTLNSIRPNRDSARCGRRIDAAAVTGRYGREAEYRDDFASEWSLDVERGVARLAEPSAKLKGFRVDLEPFLGCIGIAPDEQQAFTANWLGPWGGNLDYRGLRGGTTLYLPVYQTGALLFVGDGHAAQGDGELTGDALETSMDVEFTVDLISGLTRKASNGPRAENDEYLIVMGIAGSMPDAFRKATTLMAEWLEHDYQLSANEAAMVLGTCIRYEIAEVVNPQINIVAKIRKAVLAPLRG